MLLGFLMSQSRKNSVRDKAIRKKWIYLERNIDHRVWAISEGKSSTRVWDCQFLSVQSFSRVRLFVTPWTAARQASLSITNFQSLLKLISIELVMPSNDLTLCCPPFLLPSIFPSTRVFSNESVLHIRWTEFQLHHQSFQ